MADQRIKDLPEVSTPAVGDKLVLDGATSRSITAENLYNAVINSDPDLAAFAAKTAPAGAVVGTTDNQTLTNKTLTNAVINSPTGIVKSDVGLGSVDNTSDAGKPVSTAQQTALNLKANLASPTFTGTPAGPTAGVDANTTQLATTAWYVGQQGSLTPAMDGTASVGTSLKWAHHDHVHPTDTSRAPLASPALTGTPTAPTASNGTNTTQIATTAFVLANGGGGGGRTKISSNTTYYVRTDGNNANAGTANNSGGAWLTLQYADDFIRNTLDISAGVTVTVQIGDGTYAEGVTAAKPHVGPGTVVYQGNSSTPTNVIVNSATKSGSFEAISGANITVKDFQVANSVLHGLYAKWGGVIRIGGGIAFGNCAIGQQTVSFGGVITADGSYSVVGDALYHAYAHCGIIRSQDNALTVTLVGSRAFTRFVYCTQGSYLYYATTYTGTCTGQKFYITAGGNLSMDQASSNLPGSIAGKAYLDGLVDNTTDTIYNPLPGAFDVNRNGTNQTGMTAAGYTKVAFTTEVRDTDGWFDSTTNYRYTPQLAGLYNFELQIGAAYGTSGETCQAVIYKNGALVKTGLYLGQTSLASGTGNFNSSCGACLTMNGTTDYVEAYVYLPAAVTGINGVAANTHFRGWRVGS